MGTWLLMSTWLFQGNERVVAVGSDARLLPRFEPGPIVVKSGDASQIRRKSNWHKDLLALRLRLLGDQNMDQVCSQGV